MAGTQSGTAAGARLALALLAALIVASPGCGPDATPVDETDAPAHGAEVGGELADQLRALGYADWEAIPDAHRGLSGVQRHDRARTQPGFNLWRSRARNRAILMDNDGRTRHAWEAETGGSWGHVELLRDGSLLVLQEEPFVLAKLDWSSNIVWQRPLNVHHDADVGPDGNIHVLELLPREVRFSSGEIPVSDDLIAILDSDGRVRRRISFFSLLRSEIDLERAFSRSRAIAAGERKFLDLLHVNSLEIIDRDRGPILRKGRILFASRSQSLIGVVDLEKPEVVWRHRGRLDGPHQPTVLRSGNIMVFDNGYRRGFSRLVEIEPESREVVWRYRGRPRESFHSKTMGGVEELPNGNLLVTESTRGRVFELTREREIVWEYLNPDVQDDERKRATIYRMRRIVEGDLPPERWRSLVRAASGD